jgi:hypothetical protein
VLLVISRQPFYMPWMAPRGVWASCPDESLGIRRNHNELLRYWLTLQG